MFSRRTPDKRAFTLLELIVVIVILGILAAIAVPTFKSVIDKSRDEAAATTLAAVMREAQALAALDGRSTFTQKDFEDASADLALGVTGVLAAGKPVLLNRSNEYAGNPNQIHLALSGDSAGVATVSPSGNCVLVAGTTSSVSTKSVQDDLGSNCTGGSALTLKASPSTQLSYAKPPTSLDTFNAAAALKVSSAGFRLDSSARPSTTVVGSKLVSINGASYNNPGAIVVTDPTAKTSVQVPNTAGYTVVASDGVTLWAMKNTADLYSVSLTTGAATLVRTLPAPVPTLTWNADLKVLHAATSGAVYTYDPATGPSGAVASFPLTRGESPRNIAANQSTLWVLEGALLHIYSLATGTYQTYGWLGTSSASFGTQSIAAVGSHVYTIAPQGRTIARVSSTGVVTHTAGSLTYTSYDFVPGTGAEARIADSRAIWWQGGKLWAAHGDWTVLSVELP